MVTNPVDTLTQLAIHCLDRPAGSIIGSGTVLDTSRLRYLLSEHCHIDSHSIHAYVIGEHGDSEVVPWSLAHIAGVSIERYCQICRNCDYKIHHKDIAEQVRKSAYHIIDYKGSTFYGIGLSLARISAAVLRNENRVLTVSTQLNGEYGIENVCLSVPCVVGSRGVERIVDAKLTADEHKALKRSAGILQKLYDDIDK